MYVVGVGCSRDGTVIIESKLLLPWRITICACTMFVIMSDWSMDHEDWGTVKCREEHTSRA